MLESSIHNLRLALRELRAHLFGSLVVVISVAIAIGANATLLTWTSALVLSPLGELDDDGLVEVATSHPVHGFAGLSDYEYEDGIEASRSLAQLIAFDETAVSIATDDTPQRVFGMYVSPNYFEVLRLGPAQGRLLSPQDDRPGHAVAVISHRIWQSRFGGDAAVAGRSITLNGEAFEIVGVAPPEFVGTIPWRHYDLWLPLAARTVLVEGDERRSRDPRLSVLARLAPGVTAQQLQASLASVDFGQATGPRDDRHERTPVVSEVWRSPRYGGKVLVPLIIVVWIVGLTVLFIASANIAGVLLARFTARRHDLAVRLAVGATRARIFWQLLTESIVLGLLGGLAALLVAHVGARFLADFIPPTSSAVTIEASMTGETVLFVFALALSSSLVFGALPALTACSFDLKKTLQSGTAAVVGGSRSRLRKGLVLVQVVVCVVLLALAGIMQRSAAAARELSPGYDPRGVLLASLDLDALGRDEARGKALLASLHDRIVTDPSAESVTMARRAPLGLGGSSMVRGFQIAGASDDVNADTWAFTNEVGPSFFSTLGIDVVEGRELARKDDSDAPAATVVNQTMAAKYWPGESPLGRVMRIDGRELRVVGVVEDVDLIRLGEPPAPWMFFSVLQQYRPSVTLMVRTRGLPMTFASELDQLAGSVDAGLSLFGVQTFEEHVEGATFPQRLLATLAGILGSFGLVLASVGIYAVVTQSVVERRREVGVRMALGAGPRSIFAFLLRQGMTVVVIGVALGTALVPVLGVFLSDLLIAIEAFDLVTVGGVLALVLGLAFAACVVPAWPASRVVPQAAIRGD